MEFELISDLFSACLGSCGDAFEHFGKDSPEEEKDTDRVIAMLDKLGQKPGSELEDLFMDVRYNSKRFGFIAGFRCAAALLAECYAKSDTALVSKLDTAKGNQ